MNNQNPLHRKAVEDLVIYLSKELMIRPQFIHTLIQKWFRNRLFQFSSEYRTSEVIERQTNNIDFDKEAQYVAIRHITEEIINNNLFSSEKFYGAFGTTRRISILMMGFPEFDVPLNVSTSTTPEPKDTRGDRERKK